MIQHKLLDIWWQIYNVDVIISFFLTFEHLNQLFILFIFVLFFRLSNGLTLISLIFESLQLIHHFSLLAVGFLGFLLLDKVVFTIELLMEACSNPWKCKALWNVPFFVATFDFVFKHH